MGTDVAEVLRLLDVLDDVEVKSGLVLELEVDEKSWLIVVVIVTVLPPSLLLLFLRVPSTMTAPSTMRMTMAATTIPLRVLYQDLCRCGGKGCGGDPLHLFGDIPLGRFVYVSGEGHPPPSCCLSCSESFKRFAS